MKQSRKKRYARRLDNPRYFTSNGPSQYTVDVCKRIMLDEFEAIRLVDIEGLSQIEAAKDMQVSRATIQRLLVSGRKKIAEAMLHNCDIEITNDIANIKLKGENKFNIEDREHKVIAFPTSNKVTIDQDIEYTKEFVIYKTKDSDIEYVEYVQPQLSEKSTLAQFLKEHQIDVVITGCLHQDLIQLMEDQNIDVILGAKGRIDVNLNEYLRGFLTSKANLCDTEGRIKK